MELDQILKGEDSVNHVKAMRIKWLGHIERMQEGRMSKHLLHGHFIGIRKNGKRMKRCGTGHGKTRNKRLQTRDT